MGFNRELLLEHLPSKLLPESAWVDFLNFCACNKPVVRTKLMNVAGINELNSWCANYDLFMVVDNDLYVCISFDKSSAITVLNVDRSTKPHTYQLGLLLGYPECCCAYVDSIGESKIDELAIQISTWDFLGKYKIIDPSGYLNGQSLISHLPCSPNCHLSLELAHRSLMFLVAQQEKNRSFCKRWETWIAFDK